MSRVRVTLERLGPRATGSSPAEGRYLTHSGALSAEQLAEIRKTKLSRVICDNTDLIDTIQVYPLVLPDHEM